MLEHNTLLETLPRKNCSIPALSYVPSNLKAAFFWAGQFSFWFAAILGGPWRACACVLGILPAHAQRVFAISCGFVAFALFTISPATNSNDCLCGLISPPGAMGEGWDLIPQTVLTLLGFWRLYLVRKIPLSCSCGGCGGLPALAGARCPRSSFVRRLQRGSINCFKS